MDAGRITDREMIDGSDVGEMDRNRFSERG